MDAMLIGSYRADLRKKMKNSIYLRVDIEDTADVREYRHVCMTRFLMGEEFDALVVFAKVVYPQYIEMILKTRFIINDDHELERRYE